MSPSRPVPPPLSPAQVRALVGPVRQELVDVLESAGPSSVAELGAHLGRPADALYHHLRRLEKVGLVVERERRKEGRHVFAVYDLARRPVRLNYAAPVRSVDIGRVVAAAQRLTRVNELLEELVVTLAGGRPEPDATPISLSFVLAPSPSRRAPRAHQNTPKRRNARP